MKKSFIVIGLGRFGSSVAKELAKNNCDILAVDVRRDAVDSIASSVPHCVIADATKSNVLEELGASHIDHAVVAIGNNLRASILVTMNLKKLGVKNITVRADEESHKEVYTLLGATEVIIPEEASAISLSNQIMSDSILDYYPLTDDYAIVQCFIGENFEVKSLIDLDVRNNYDINIIGIMHEGKFLIPKGTDLLMAKDVVIIVGKKPKIRKFDNFLNN